MRSHLPFRICVVTAMAGLFMAAGPLARADSAWDLSRQIVDPAWSWSAAQTLQMSRAAIRHQRFSVALEPDEAARRLMAVRTGAVFDRLQLAGNQVLLSGVRGESHWIAQFERRPAGTRGWVSSLTPSPAVRAAFDATALVPAQARRVLHLTARDANSATITRFVLEGQETKIMSHIRQRLLRAQWQPPETSTAAAGPAWQEWQHSRGARLAVYVQARPGGVALTFWHRPGEIQP